MRKKRKIEKPSGVRLRDDEATTATVAEDIEESYGRETRFIRIEDDILTKLVGKTLAEKAAEYYVRNRRTLITMMREYGDGMLCVVTNKGYYEVFFDLSQWRPAHEIRAKPRGIGLYKHLNETGGFTKVFEKAKKLIVPRSEKLTWHATPQTIEPPQVPVK